MKLKDRLEFIKKGEDFLDYKREQLIQRIREIWDQYQNQQESFYDLLVETLRNLNNAYSHMGKQELLLISDISKIQYQSELNLSFEKQIGILIPSINFDLHQKEKLPPYSFQDTCKHIGDLLDSSKKFLKEMMSYIVLEDILLKYATNFQEVNRRINGLKNIFKPNLRESIGKISRILEEIDRENFIRLKKTKEMLKEGKK